MRPAAEAKTERTAAALRHSAGVRITHWLIAFSVLDLLVSGVEILVAHPRLYWGETGAVGTPSLVDLPIPFIIGLSPWNRPIHFFFVWALVLSGTAYVLASLFTRHLRNDLLPAKADLDWKPILGTITDHLRWRRTQADNAWSYNVVQRLTYLAVIFVLFPAVVWTGLAMSPALMSVFPGMVTVLGGYQSARTLHFIFAFLILIFLIVHLVMLLLVGFTSHVRAMLTGRIPQERAR